MNKRKCDCDISWIKTFKKGDLRAHILFHNIIKHVNQKKKFYVKYKTVDLILKNNEFIYPTTEIYIQVKLENVLSHKQLYFNKKISEILSIIYELKHKYNKVILSVKFKGDYSY